MIFRHFSVWTLCTHSYQVSYLHEHLFQMWYFFNINQTFIYKGVDITVCSYMFFFYIGVAILHLNMCTPICTSTPTWSYLLLDDSMLYLGQHTVCMLCLCVPLKCMVIAIVKDTTNRTVFLTASFYRIQTWLRCYFLDMHRRPRENLCVSVYMHTYFRTGKKGRSFHIIYCS